MSDWETVTILRKKAPNASHLKSEQEGLAVATVAGEEWLGDSVRCLVAGLKTSTAVNRARREGAPVDTQQKWGGGQNKQHVVTKNTAKLDRETEELKHDKIPLDLGKTIQQGRQAMGWSQKDLATRCNEKPQVINDYEAGRGIPNQAVIGKIERALGIKLRGKDMGCVLLPKESKK